MAGNPHISKLPYPPEVLGHVRIEADPRTVAGSMATVRITYTAGRFGIDDQGSLRFLLRFASDAGRPQFDRPGAPNYCTASASNGTRLMLEYHPRGAFRRFALAVRPETVFHSPQSRSACAGGAHETVCMEPAKRTRLSSTLTSGSSHRSTCRCCTAATWMCCVR